jgi:hypothetical protein
MQHRNLAPLAAADGGCNAHCDPVSTGIAAMPDVTAPLSHLTAFRNWNSRSTPAGLSVVFISSTFPAQGKSDNSNANVVRVHTRILDAVADRLLVNI